MMQFMIEILSETWLVMAVFMAIGLYQISHNRKSPQD